MSSHPSLTKATGAARVRTMMLFKVIALLAGFSLGTLALASLFDAAWFRFLDKVVES